MNLSLNTYLFLKALHIIAVISWMAGLLYLPRLFVYHSQINPNSETSDIFKVMERRLLKAIMNPAMVVTLISGTLILLSLSSMNELWVYVKVSSALALTLTHFYLLKAVKIFAMDANHKNTKFYRVLNEIPTLLMIIIVSMVIFKPT